MQNCFHNILNLFLKNKCKIKIAVLKIKLTCSFDCGVGRRSHSFCRPGITPTSVESKKLFNVYSVELQSQSFHIEWLHRGCFTDFHFVHFFVEFWGCHGLPIAREIGFIGMNHFTPKEGWVASNNVGISRMLYELWEIFWGGFEHNYWLRCGGWVW